jgi:hypothetical protein
MMAMLTLTLAIIGTVTGVGSLVANMTAFRRSGPVVKVNVFQFIPMIKVRGREASEPGELMTVVEAVNTGRAPITVTDWALEMRNGESVVPQTQVPQSDALPFRLEQGASARWFVPTDEVRAQCEYHGASYSRDLVGYVQLAGGKVVRAERSGIGSEWEWTGNESQTSGPRFGSPNINYHSPVLPAWSCSGRSLPGSVDVLGAEETEEMLQRLTEPARRVMVSAQHEARMLNHNAIDTEHILLGLIREGKGVAVQALELLGISLEVVRQEVQEIVGRGERTPSGDIPLTLRVKKVLELSLREALQFIGETYISTEHILLGLIREGTGVAAQVLVEQGADLNRTRQQVIQILYMGDK